MYLGIEIGGTKLQIGLGQGDGSVVGLWRGTVDVAAGAAGIRAQILTAIPELLRSARVAPTRLLGVGVGFGGPIEDAGRRIIKSHQINGWDDFPLADWLSNTLQVPVAIGNDADVAGLAEALHGAGRGFSPLFYITIGSGIGGGFVVDGQIFRGIGRGAAEIGHLRVLDHLTGCKPVMSTLEDVASGWGIEKRLRRLLAGGEGRDSLLWKWAEHNPASVTTEMASRARASARRVRARGPAGIARAAFRSNLRRYRVALPARGSSSAAESP